MSSRAAIRREFRQALEGPTDGMVRLASAVFDRHCAWSGGGDFDEAFDVLEDLVRDRLQMHPEDRVACRLDGSDIVAYATGSR